MQLSSIFIHLLWNNSTINNLRHTILGWIFIVHQKCIYSWKYFRAVFKNLYGLSAENYLKEKRYLVTLLSIFIYKTITFPKYDLIQKLSKLYQYKWNNKNSYKKSTYFFQNYPTCSMSVIYFNILRKFIKKILTYALSKGCWKKSYTSNHNTKFKTLFMMIYVQE